MTFRINLSIFVINSALHGVSVLIFKSILSSQNDDCNASSDDENVNGESNTGGNKQGAYTNQGPCHQEPGAPGKGNKKCKHGHHNHERHHGAQQDEMSYHSNSERGQYMQALKQMQRSAEGLAKLTITFFNLLTILKSWSINWDGENVIYNLQINNKTFIQNTLNY